MSNFSWIRKVFTPNAKAVSTKKRSVRLFVETLEERAVPAVVETFWTNGAGTGLWSAAGNWSNGLPTASKVAVLDANRTNANVVFDNTVLAANATVEGLRTDNLYSGTLSLTGRQALTISAAADTGSGFKWHSGNISQGSLQDLLVINGGGDAAHNIWDGGTIGSTTTLSELDINGNGWLQITGSAVALGDSIIIGKDTNGGSTLELYNQASALQVNNNAYIEVSATTNKISNSLLFDTDVTKGGHATKGLATTSVDSFIDNYGNIVRSNPGSYQTDLPIRNNSSNASLDLQSSLQVSGSSVNKTAGYGVDQEAGLTILRDKVTLQAKGVLINAGDLQTYGGGNATISRSAGFIGQALTFDGGTLTISADNHAQYGTLTVNFMTWNGGTFETYVNGGTAGQQTQIACSILTLPGGNTDHLHVNVNGALTSGLIWTPISADVNITGTVTNFDSGALFTIGYPAGPKRIIVTSR